MSTIQFDVKCHKCGTNLTGLDSAGLCPTCARRIAETVDDRILDTVSGAVATDLTCVTCAYNLRTMPHDAICPECATPVVNSLVVEELRFCDPNWLRSIRRGLNIVVASFIVSIVLGIFVAMFFMVQAATAGGGIPTTSMTWVTLPSLCMYALLVWGVFCMTVPKPDEPAEDRVNKYAKAARVLMVLAMAVSLLTLLGDYDLNAWATDSINLWQAAPELFANLFMTAAAICVLMVFGRIAVLARRPGLKKLNTWLSWLVGVQMVLGFVSGIVAVFAMPSMLAGMPGGTPATNITTNVGPGGATVSANYNINLGAVPTTGGAPANATGGGVAAPPGVPAGPISAGAMAMVAVFGCVSGSVSMALFVLGVIALTKFRKLLSNAIAASLGPSPAIVA